MNNNQFTKKKEVYQPLKTKLNEKIKNLKDIVVSSIYFIDYFYVILEISWSINTLHSNLTVTLIILLK